MTFTRSLILASFLAAGTALAAGGTITGKVTFSGSAPKNATYAIGKNVKACGTSKPLDRIVVKNGNVANCFVYLKDVRGGSTGNVKPLLEQKGCEFLPHAQVAQLNSQMTVTNDDDVLHNIHGYFVTDHTTAFNFAQPLQGQRTQMKLNRPGLIEIQCDAGHAWMSAYIYVANNGYVDVTHDDGVFTIPNVSPGTYTLVCWHEGWKQTGEKEGRPIFTAPVVQEQQVTVSAGGTVTANFSLHN